MFFVYVIQSERNGNFYKGQTEDLEKRLKAHNSGKTKSTKHGIPWKLVYYEIAETRVLALKREKYLKTAAGRRFLKGKIASAGSPPD